MFLCFISEAALNKADEELTEEDLKRAERDKADRDCSARGEREG